MIKSSNAVIAKKPRLLFVVNVAWFFVSHRLPLADAASSAGYEVHVAAGPDRHTDIELIRRSGHTFIRYPLSVDGWVRLPTCDSCFV